MNSIPPPACGREPETYKLYSDPKRDLLAMQRVKPGAVPASRKPKPLLDHLRVKLTGSEVLKLGFCFALSAAVASAQPWSDAAAKLETEFIGPIAQSLIAVAIVLCGFGFAFGEGQTKKLCGGLAFGGAMALAAIRFRDFFFPA